MKSIREKAEEYGLQYPVIHYDADGNTYDDVNKPSMDFETGANYVLEEIERIVNSAIENKSMTIPTWRLNFIIKQLKK